MRLHSKHSHPIMLRHNGIEIWEQPQIGRHDAFTAVRCLLHEVEYMADSMADAQRAARDPASWCPECKEVAKRQRKAKAKTKKKGGR